MLYMVYLYCIKFLPFLFSLLLRRECCSFSNGEFLKAGLQDLEQWCSRTTEEVNIFLSFFGNFNKTNYNQQESAN